MLESFPQRVIRHIKNGEFDPKTLLTGLSQAKNLVTKCKVYEGGLRFMVNRPNFMGIEDLAVAEYSYSDELVDESFPASLRVYDFPLRSRVIPILTSKAGAMHTSESIDEVDGAIATFSGPTFIRGDYIPNNGFYFHGATVKNDFCETSPPGQRRGAFGFKLDGTLELMTDKEKWQVVHEEFKGYQALIGTSFYFLSRDLIGEHTEPTSALSRRNQLSYLFQYHTKAHTKRIGFAISDELISRYDMKFALDDYIRRSKGIQYKAVELERSRCTCIVKNNGQTDAYIGQGFFRRDHYVVVLD
ncbi:MAG: hypothetical protein PHQ59_03390 [Candidatus Daviesbacteria bacterium]|nr:hypothetical protein [Candidatus Daviesbacteria bacterium]